MKKINKILVTIVGMLSVLILASCGDQSKPKVEFLKADLNLTLGQEADLEDVSLLKIENTNLNNIHFVSNNQDVVFVSPNKKIKTVGKGTTTIVATVGDSRSTIVVNVSVPIQPFAKVSEIVYNPQTAEVYWNPSFMLVNGREVVATGYDVKITKDNVAYENFTKLSATKYKFTEGGNFGVEVRAIASGFAYSEKVSISFTVLNTPQNFVFEKGEQNQHTVKWDQVLGAELYEFKINQESHVLATNSYTLNLEAAGTYTLSVKAIKSQNEHSAFSTPIVVTKLAKPVLKLESGVLRVNLSQQQQVEHFALTVVPYQSDDDEVRNYTSVTGEFDLSDLPAGDYVASVIGVAQAAANVISSEVSELLTFSKLSSPTITFDNETKTVEVIGSDTGLKMFVQDIATNQIEQFNFENGKYLINKQFGEFKLWAQYIATEENVINSAISTPLTVKVLAFARSVQHQVEVVEGQQTSVVSFQKVIGAKNYDIKIDGNIVGAEMILEDQNRVWFRLNGNTETLFANATEYEIEVVAKDDGYEHILVSGQEANNKTIVTRLDAPSQINFTNPAQIVPITWEAPAGSTGFSYVLYKNNVKLSQGDITVATFEVQNLTFGNYKLQIITKANGKEFLSSLNYAEIEFSKHSKLAAPIVSFNRDNMSIVVTAVENADTYQVLYNSAIVATLTNNLSFDVSAYMQEATQHEFLVKALNLADNFENGGNLISSDLTSIKIVKLESVAQVIFEDEQVFKYDSNLVMTVQYGPEYTLQVKVDGIVVDLANFDFATLSQFTLSVVKVANQNLASPYYVSSEEFVVNYERLQTPQNLSFVNWLISWDENQDAYGYEVAFTAENFEETVVVTENSLNLLNQTFIQQLENGFTFAVKALSAQEYIAHQQQHFLSSFVSAPAVVEVLPSPEIILIEKLETNRYKVTWQEIANVQYVVGFEESSQTISVNEFVVVLDGNKAQHTLTIKAISPNQISSNQIELVFEKPADIETVNVTDSQTFQIANAILQGSKLFVNGVEKDAQQAIEILDISAQNGGKFEFALQVMAEFKENNVYYTTSNQTTFAFEKHVVVNNLRVEDNQIKWQENPHAINYELVLSNSQNQSLSILIPARDQENNYVNSIYLTDGQIADFVQSSQNQYFVNIRIKAQDFALSAGQTGKIDGEFGPSVEIEKLAKVENIKAEAFDLADKQQEAITISWDAVTGANSYNVYVNGALLVANHQTTSVVSSHFTFENSIVENSLKTGKFVIEVVAYAQNQIWSEISDGLEIVRLEKVKGFKTSNLGVVQWEANALSSSFVFYAKNQSGFDSEQFVLENVVSHNFASLLELEEFKDGRFELYILVSGNGETMFSSTFQKIEIVRLDAPNFEVLGDRIVVEESLIYANAGFELVVYFKQDGQEELVEIEKVALTAGQRLLPTEWKFKNGDPIVQKGTFVFELVTKETGYLTSVKTIQEKVKLDGVVIDGFKKVEDATLVGETTYEFVVTVDNLAQTQIGEDPDIEIEIVVSNSKDSKVFTYLDQTAKNRQGQIVYDMNQLFLAMKGNFKVEIKVSAVGYIDSKIVSLTGTRLDQNTELRAKNGVISWARSLGSSASGYMLKVNYGGGEESQTENTLIKNISNLAILSDNLVGISGAITANLKVTSSMAMNTIVRNNVVLDSFYMGTVEELGDGTLMFAESPYIASKLAPLSDVEIKQGMFYFKTVSEEQSADYVLIALDQEFEGREYSLSVELENDGYIHALSSMFYQGQYRLSRDKVYTFSIKALAVAANGLDSDAGQELKVKVLAPVSNLNVSWKEYETGETNRFDTVVISWSSAVGISNPQYIYSLNASSVTEGAFNIVDTNEYIIRSNNALNARNHNFRVRVMGSSEQTGEGFYYLTSEYSSSVTLTGLAVPEVEVKNGVFTWQQVPYAEGYYIYYMKRTSDMVITPNTFSQNKTWFSDFVTSTSWRAPESFSDSEFNQIYYFAVVAINRDISMRYMPSGYGTNYVTSTDQGGQEIDNAFGQYVVLKSPDLFENNNGVLVWTGDYSYTFGLPPTLNQGNNPFVYLPSFDSLFDIMINVRIEDTNARVLTKEFNAVSLFYANVFGQSWFKAIAPQLGFNINQKFGIAHYDQFINESFPTIKAGSNFISAMQIGNNGSLISSKYNNGREYYIPQQVNTSISNSVVSWSEIVLPAGREYLNTTGKYVVISEDDEGKRIVVTKTNDLSINLIDFVNNDTLKPGNHKIYVIVAGDGEFYLNGIAGPYISTFVLPTISARLDKGVLLWDSMQNTSGYLVKAIAGSEEYNFIQNMNVNIWDFAQLRATDALGNNIEYHLTIQATGNGRTIISGKETDFGGIIKLKTPVVSIVKGVFEWQNIENNIGYMVYISGQDQATFALGTGITQYESTYKGFNSYNFRTVGSTTGQLGSSTLNYAISSSMNQNIDAVMLQSVKNTETFNGQIKWQAMTDYSNISINEYKLTFDQINFKPATFLTSNDYTIEVIEGSTYVLYQLSTNYAAGVYKVYLQAYTDRTFTREGVVYQYLLGEIDQVESSTQFEKLSKVENVRVVNGVIYWDDPNSHESEYRLTLVQGAQSYVFTTNTTSFDVTKLSSDELARFDLVSADTPVDVKIQVLGNDTDRINSDEVRTNNFTKLKTITEIIYVTDENEQTGFRIRWYLPSAEIGVSNYEYVISYIDNPDDPVVKLLSSTESNFIVKGYDNDRKLHYGEIDAAYLLDRNSLTLAYKIAAVPVSQSNFISSSFSEERSVSPPESLSGEFMFDAASQKISWAYEREASDVVFRIVDEIVEIDSNNIVTVIKTNVYMSQEKQFIPQEIGLHRIKIAVVLGTGIVSSSYVYFNHQTTTGLINNPAFEVVTAIETQNFTVLNFNLFQSGEGSSANPYIISNQNHFANIAHRTSKPTYLGGEAKFVFVQQNELVANNLTSGIVGFAGIYDGQGFSLTYHLTSSKTTTTQEVALFESVAIGGQVKNLVVNAKLTINHSVSVSQVKMSAFAVTNNGTIENVLIKSFELVNNITNSQVRYSYGGVAVQNNGTIVNVISQAHLTLIGGVGHVSMLNSDITVGGLVENNAGQIANSGSYANFKITARRVTVAGVAVVSQANATITRAFNRGSLDIVITAGNSTESYIAGIVGRNSGIISSSYSSASSIKLDLMGTSNTVYVSGFAGLVLGANGSLINNSFTLTTNITVVNRGASTVDIGILIARTTAQDNQAQVRSYYKVNTSLVVVNGTLPSFKASSIDTMSALLASLNAQDAGAFRILNDFVSHVWEQNFELA